MNELANEATANRSKAFESFVIEPDDPLGLLAYALYKRSIHERMANGGPATEPQHRNPQPHEIEVYTNQADTYLQAFKKSVIDSERASILKDGLGGLADQVIGTIEKSNEDIKHAIRAATGFWWPGVVVGVVAWIISIVLTIVVVYSAPAWVKGLVLHLNQG